MWWFEAPARPATPKGHPSSLAEHRFPKSLSYLHQDLRFSFVAHVAGVFDATHDQPGGERAVADQPKRVADFGDLGIGDPLAGVGVLRPRPDSAPRCRQSSSIAPIAALMRLFWATDRENWTPAAGGHHRFGAVRRVAAHQDRSDRPALAGGADRLGDLPGGGAPGAGLAGCAAASRRSPARPARSTGWWPAATGPCAAAVGWRSWCARRRRPVWRAHRPGAAASRCP